MLDMRAQEPGANFLQSPSSRKANADALRAVSARGTSERGTPRRAPPITAGFHFLPAFDEERLVGMAINLDDLSYGAEAALGKGGCSKSVNPTPASRPRRRSKSNTWW